MHFKDIADQVTSTKGVPMPIKDPNGFPLYLQPIDEKKDPEGEKQGFQLTTTKTKWPCRLLLISEHSRPFRERKAELWNKRIQGDKLRDFTQAEEEDLKTVASGVVGMENVIWDTPFPLPFDDENVFFFLDAYRLAFDDANRFIADASRFFDGGQKS